MANTEYFFTFSLAPKIADLGRAFPGARGVSLAKACSHPCAVCDGACRFAPRLRGACPTTCIPIGKSAFGWLPKCRFATKHPITGWTGIEKGCEMFALTEKVAIVTGASSGIGRATA
ncbi:MAG: hypothetical protein E5X10_26690, partial [Mesorhizobium sp.]